MTHEFDFDIKHVDYEEWFSQISQAEENNCLKFSEPDLSLIHIYGFFLFA